MIDIVNADKMRDFDKGDCADCLVAAAAGWMFFTRSNVKGSPLLRFLKSREEALLSAAARSSDGDKYGVFEMIQQRRILNIPAFSERLVELEPELALS